MNRIFCGWHVRLVSLFLSTAMILTAQQAHAAVSTQIAAGDSHTVAICADGTVKTWGSNSSGQLGDGTTTHSNVPVTVVGLDGVVTQVAAGDSYTVALFSDGSVKTWGTNYNGALGDGTKVVYSSKPVTVVGLDGVVSQIASARDYTVALMSDGKVKAWGVIGHGQFGKVEKFNSNTPIEVTGLGGEVKQIAAGWSHVLVLLKDGTVKTIGNSDFGQLDNAKLKTPNKTTPETVTAIAMSSHAVALFADGTIKTWGENYNGELGNGTSGLGTNSSIPLPVSGLDGKVVSIAAKSHTVALISDGTLRTWGYNHYGQLGNGTRTNSNTPLTIIGLNGFVTHVATGNNHTVAIFSDGTIKSWGKNDWGQLGNGATVDSTRPVTVVGCVGVATQNIPGRFFLMAR